MLKYLDETVEQAIAKEAESAPVTITTPLLSRQTPSNVCGFELPEVLVKSDQKARALNERLLRITAYRNEAKRLREKLATVGIEPIAVITAKAFDRLIAEMGLFILQPNASGFVAVNREPILALRPNTRWVPASFVGLLVVMYVLAFSNWGWSVMGDSPWPFLGAAALLVALAVAVGVTADFVSDKITDNVFARRAETWLSRLSWEQTLAALSNNHVFATPDYDNSAFRRQLVLPPAPREVIDMVCRFTQRKESARAQEGFYDLQIAAESGAITFKDGLAGLFDGAAIKAQLRHEEMLRRDPILFVRNGGAVAILAQYGELPLEQATVDQIVNSEHLL